MIRYMTTIFLVPVLLILILSSCGGGKTTSTIKTQPSESSTASNQPEVTKARDMEAYFSGKSINLLVGYAPGGGYDTYARLFSEFLPHHLPGKAKVNVTNRPGAGSLLATQEFMRSEPNGLNMMIMSGGIIMRSVLGEKLKGFDFKQPMYIGLPDYSNDDGAIYSHTYKTWDEARNSGKVLKLGATQDGATLALAAEWLKIVGEPIDVVYGYGGSAEVSAAFNRKELDLISLSGLESDLKIYPDWIGKAKPFMYPLLGWREPLRKDHLQKAGWEQPPMMKDYIKATHNQVLAYELAIDLGARGARVFALPPGVPNDIYQTLVEAFANTVNDPAFIEASKTRALPVGYLSGQKYAERLNEVSKADPEVIEMMNKIFRTK